eukprot:TRINITY_DN11403_c0_g1_i2.p1 TRINITY_DN11403_c0_g1~~TRINITY_DN11403_c0_g1_i2.p1  ORF type:complete len:572 (+),score=118.55 TRINITY_DN11403_c0_g1_i2:123-1838(+)
MEAIMIDEMRELSSQPGVHARVLAKLATRGATSFKHEMVRAVLAEENTPMKWMEKYQRMHVIRMVLTTHPWLSLYFYHPNDMMTFAPRLTILVVRLMSFLAINSLFFGQSTSPVRNFIIIIWTSLFGVPLQRVFPWLFSSCIWLKRFSLRWGRAPGVAQQNPASDDASDGPSAAPAPDHSPPTVMQLTSSHMWSGRPRLSRYRTIDNFLWWFSNHAVIVAYIFSFVWLGVAAFTCLLYGLSFDLKNSGGSAQWLLICCISILQDVLLAAPLAAAIPAYVMVRLMQQRVLLHGDPVDPQQKQKEREKKAKQEKKEKEEKEKEKEKEASAKDEAPSILVSRTPEGETKHAPDQQLQVTNAGDADKAENASGSLVSSKSKKKKKEKPKSFKSLISQLEQEQKPAKQGEIELSAIAVEPGSWLQGTVTPRAAVSPTLPHDEPPAPAATRSISRLGTRAWQRSPNPDSGLGTPAQSMRLLSIRDSPNSDISMASSLRSTPARPTVPRLLLGQMERKEDSVSQTDSVLPDSARSLLPLDSGRSLLGRESPPPEMTVADLLGPNPRTNVWMQNFPDRN